MTLGLNFRERAGAIAAMIPLGQGVQHAVGAKNKIVLLVDPAQRVIGIIAMTTSSVVLTLLKEQTPYMRYSQAVLTKSRLLTVMDGADKLSFGVDRICAVIAPFDMVTSIPTIIPLLTADVRANINTIRMANDFIEGVKTRIRPSPPASPNNLQIAAVPTSLFGRVTGWCTGTISWVANAVKRPISATIESREKQLIATASGHITDGVLKGGLGFLTSQALKVYLASFTGFGIELVFRGVIGITSYTPEEVEAMAAWTRFCVQWTIYIALVNQSLKQWRDKRAEARNDVEHPVAALMNSVDLSALRERMRNDEEIIPTFEQFREQGEAAFTRPAAEEVDQEPPVEPAVLEIVATEVGTHALSTLVNQGALPDATNTQVVVGALAQQVMPVLDITNPRGEAGRRILAGVGTYLSELVTRKPVVVEEQDQPPEVESTPSRWSLSYWRSESAPVEESTSTSTEPGLFSRAWSAIPRRLPFTSTSTTPEEASPATAPTTPPLEISPSPTPPRTPTPPSSPPPSPPRSPTPPPPPLVLTPPPSPTPPSPSPVDSSQLSTVSPPPAPITPPEPTRTPPRTPSPVQSPQSSPVPPPMLIPPVMTEPQTVVPSPVATTASQTRLTSPIEEVTEEIEEIPEEIGTIQAVGDFLVSVISAPFRLVYFSVDWIISRILGLFSR